MILLLNSTYSCQNRTLVALDGLLVASQCPSKLLQLSIIHLDTKALQDQLQI